MDRSKKIDSISLSENSTMIEALKRMDKTYKRLLLVFDTDGKFVNVLSIGDIQRAIIKGHSLETQVTNVLRKETRLAFESEDYESIKNRMLKYRAECMPVIDHLNNLKDVYFWEDVFSNGEKMSSFSLDIPVIIMAGGKGTRLKPITNILPKPLIPIRNKSMLEMIIERFNSVGCKQFFISVNYKADMIKYYLSQVKNNDGYQIEFIEESEPLGTAGSLSLLSSLINQTFFVTNCDIIIEEDYYQIYEYHKSNGNELTVVAALKHYKIPYGILETEQEGLLKYIQEKPELTFKINSGMYILEPHLLKEVPQNKFYHITDLIKSIIHRNGRVGVFPVSEGSWKDIGEWDEYLKNVSRKS